ncbi:MAG: ABC transporter permease [Spirochaetaceae bacterium]|nr:MAG: ABC transporter permease [Spirochaetaceae bacterium]
MSCGIGGRLGFSSCCLWCCGRVLHNSGRATAPTPVRARIWYNPQLESSQILIPGLIAIILVITAVVSSAVGIAREREQGSMEQLSVSPLRPVELVTGKTIPYAAIYALVSLLIIVLGTVFFGVRSTGSLAALTVIRSECLSCGPAVPDLLVRPAAPAVRAENTAPQPAAILILLSRYTG